MNCTTDHRTFSKMIVACILSEECARGEWNPLNWNGSIFIFDPVNSNRKIMVSHIVSHICWNRPRQCQQDTRQP